jgi:hypothetical protein
MENKNLLQTGSRFSYSSPTPKTDIVLIVALALYISLASTVTSLPAKDTNSIKTQRAFVTLSAIFFSIVLGIWGTLRFTNAKSTTAIAAVILGSSFLISGAFANSFKNSALDGTTERYAATTTALFPAIIGMTATGIAKLL